MAVKRKTWPINVLISVGVSKIGRTSVFFVELGIKNRNDLLARMLPEMGNLSRGDYIFLQEGERSQTAKATLEYLNENCSEYVKPDQWPPNSPNLTILWANFEKKVWKNKPHDVESLEQTIIKEGRDYLQGIIENAIDSFRKRLRQITRRMADT